VEEHLSETHALSAVSSMDQVDCQEVLRGPSVGVVPILLRNCISSTTLSSAAGMISSLADVRTYLCMCFKFYALCVKETLLQKFKHSVWVTSNRIDNTECPTTYQTQQFFSNSKTNEDIAMRFEQEYVRR
jgi:hypothetical protein